MRDPALARLADAAVSGLAPAGPERCRRPVEVAFDGRPGVMISARLSMREAGFSLHIARNAYARVLANTPATARLRESCSRLNSNSNLEIVAGCCAPFSRRTER